MQCLKLKFQKPKKTVSFRKNRFFALRKNAILSGIRFVFLTSKKPHQIPDKFSLRLARRKPKRKLSGMTFLDCCPKNPDQRNVSAVETPPHGRRANRGTTG